MCEVPISLQEDPRRLMSSGMYCRVAITHRPDDGGSTQLRNVGQHLLDYTAVHAEFSKRHTRRRENLKSHNFCFLFSFSFSFWDLEVGTGNCICIWMCCLCCRRFLTNNVKTRSIASDDARTQVVKRRIV
jgi:hypothetical protein